ncbi:DUF6339 family protein [Streptomyces sp. NPDC055099]
MSMASVYQAGVDIPGMLAQLPDAAALRELKAEALRGTAAFPSRKLDRLATPMDGGPTRWHASPVRELFDTAMQRFDRENAASSDAWLAPRLHAVLRLTRREAGKRELWNHLALRIAPDYVLWRWLGNPTDKNPKPSVNPRRFVGPYHVQAFARLWWAAETFRDGADYKPVVTAGGNQEMFNSALRLEVFLHRPTTQTMIRMLRDGTVDSTRAANGLIKAVNAAGSTVQFELVAQDEPLDARARRQWIDELDSAPPVPHDVLPQGPDDGSVPYMSTITLLPLFQELFRSAQIRGRRLAEDGEEH